MDTTHNDVEKKRIISNCIEVTESFSVFALFLLPVISLEVMCWARSRCTAPPREADTAGGRN